LLQAGHSDIETEFVLCKTWSMKVEHEVKLDRTEMRIYARMCVFLLQDKKSERNGQLRESTVSNRVSEPEHFWHVYTPVARGPVLKLTVIHSSSGKVNGQSEIHDPLKF